MSLSQQNSNLHKELKDCLGSNQAIFEILFVYHLLKPVCRVLLNKDELNNIRRICRSYDLNYSIARYKFTDSDNICKGGFQNKVVKVPLEYREGRFVLYISASKDDAERAANLEETDTVEFGKILGYPDCCIEFFVENLPNQAGRNMDFILPSCRGIGVFPFVNNRCIRYFGITVLSHFPCDLNCEKSRKLGELYFNLIDKYDPQTAEKYKNELRSFVLYTENEGIYYSPDYIHEQNIIKVGEVTSTVSDSKILNLICKNREIHYKTQNNFKIGRNIFNSKNETLLMFD